VRVRDDKTPIRLLLCTLRPPVSRTLESAYGRRPNGKSPHSHPRSRSWAGTGLATTLGVNKIRQDAINSTTLYTVPPHVIRTVRHDCKLPLFAYKRRGQPPGRKGDDGQCTLTRFPPSPRYWHQASINPQGPRGPASSPTSLVAPLCKHHDAKQYSASSTPLLDVRPRPEPG
jgi:hypothetical protein